jgi:hypothetical protein
VGNIPHSKVCPNSIATGAGDAEAVTEQSMTSVVSGGSLVAGAVRELLV